MLFHFVCYAFVRISHSYRSFTFGSTPYYLFGFVYVWLYIYIYICIHIHGPGHRESKRSATFLRTSTAGGHPPLQRNNGREVSDLRLLTVVPVGLRQLDSPA